MPLARVAYQSEVELSDTISGPAADARRPSVMAHEAGGLTESAEAVEGVPPQTIAAVETGLASTQLGPVADTRTQYGARNSRSEGRRCGGLAGPRRTRSSRPWSNWRGHRDVEPPPGRRRLQRRRNQRRYRWANLLRGGDRRRRRRRRCSPAHRRPVVRQCGRRPGRRQMPWPTNPGRGGRHAGSARCVRVHQVDVPVADDGPERRGEGQRPGRTSRGRRRSRGAHGISDCRVNGPTCPLGRRDGDLERFEEQWETTTVRPDWRGGTAAPSRPGIGYRPGRWPRVGSEHALGNVDFTPPGTTTVAVVPMARKERVISTGFKGRARYSSPGRSSRRDGRRRRARRRSRRRSTGVAGVAGIVSRSRCCSRRELLPLELEVPSDPEEVDPDVAADRDVLLAPGCTWATTIPMAAVAPVAARTAPRVRWRTRDLSSSPCLWACSPGWLKVTCRWKTSLRGMSSSHHARIDTVARPAVGPL